jgi:hypothetical protein
VDTVKAKAILKEFEEKAKVRMEKLGYIVQPAERSV